MILNIISNKFIWPLDETLTWTNTPVWVELRVITTERRFHISQNSRREAWPVDAV